MKRPRPESTESGSRKVLLVSHTSNLSGAPISLAQLARKLPEQGYTPLYLIPREGPLEELLRSLRVSYEVMKGPFGHAGFLGIVRREKPCLVHVNSLVRTWPLFLSRLMGLPVIWHVREHLGGKRGYAKLIHALSDRVVVISREQAMLFEGLPRAVRIPNAVDISQFRVARTANRDRRRQTVVAYVGAIEPRKGLLTLARAFRLLKNGRQIRVMVVGGTSPENSQYERKVKEHLRALGLEKNWQFLGARSDVPAVLAASDILCHPAHVEAFSRVILEAMASGLPVVSTVVGGTPEMVDHGVTGILVQPGDERSLAEAIDTLHADRRLAERMGRAGRRKAAKIFSLELHAERVAALYDSLLAAKAARRRRL